MSSSEFPRIARLDASLVSQIAAGEVIERPASVIKELVENSLDAGATRIVVDIERGGTRLIRVRDNGHGIHPDDLRLAVESHATSKLRAPRDLEAIRSLGFRGEALSSIASVSRFELTSRRRGQDQAWSVTAEPGTGAADPLPAAGEPGTTVAVHDLFQSVPARRKFLRTERTEFLHILETVRRLALCCFDVDLRLEHNRRRVLHCRQAEAGIDQRLRDILGAAFVREARAVDSRSDGMRLWGRLGGPGQARNQSDRQYFYLNGRMIRDKRLGHAVRKALEDSIPPGRYPSYVLHLDVDPAVVDVNVHPTKQEVRFRHARDVHDFIHAAVNEAMRASAGDGRRVSLPGVSGAETAAPRPAEAGWPLRELSAPYRDGHGAAPAPEAAGAPVVLGRFVLQPRADHLLLLDAAAARRYLLQLRFKEALAGGALTTRPLLVPVLLECSGAALQAARENRERLARLGLELDEAGPASLRVRALPALLSRVDALPLCREVLEALQAAGGDQRLVDVLARHGADGEPPPQSGTALRQLLDALAEAGIEPEAAGLARRLTEADLARMLKRP